MFCQLINRRYHLSFYCYHSTVRIISYNIDKIKETFFPGLHGSSIKFYLN